MRQTRDRPAGREIGQRAYLLSGEISDLEPYERARLRIETGLRQLEAAAAGDPDATRQVARVPRGRHREARPAQRHHRRLPAPRPRRRAGAGPHRIGPDDQRPDPPDRRRPSSRARRLLLARRLAMLRSEQEQSDIAGLLLLGGAFLCLIVGMYIVIRGARRLETAQRELADRIAPPAVHAREPAGPDLRDRRRRQGGGVERGLRAPVRLGSRQACAR